MEGLIDPGVGVETLTRRPAELPGSQGGEGSNGLLGS